MRDDILDQAKRSAKQGDYNAALQLFQKVGGGQGAFGEAACLHRLNRDNEAREALERCLEIDPSNEKAQVLLAKINATRGGSSTGDEHYHGKPSNIGLRLPRRIVYIPAGIFCGFTMLMLVVAKSCNVGPESNGSRQQMNVRQEREVVPREAVAMPDYKVLHEEVYDVPAKTQVTLSILVSGTITAPGLKALLRQQYDKIKKRRGFKYHPSPTFIAIYAYTSEDHYRSSLGWRWIGMLDQVSTETQPWIDLKEKAIEYLGAKPEVKYGLTEEQRRQVLKETVEVEDRATREADAAYPIVAGAGMETLDRNMALNSKLVERYEADLCRKYNITEQQRQEIIMEGFTKNWPG